MAEKIVKTYTVCEQINALSPNCLYTNNLKHISGVNFTPRELQVMACLLGGRSIKKIATLLSMAPKTAENHVRNVLLKLNHNSKEHIIDFIEQSAYFQLFKQYYAYLSIKPKFQEVLRDTARDPSASQCLIIHQQTDKQKLGWLVSLKQDLTKAGVTITDKLWISNQDSQQILQQKQITHVLYLPSDELSTEHQTDSHEVSWTNNDHEISDWLNSLQASGIGVTILGQRATEMFESLPISQHYQLFILNLLMVLKKNKATEKNIENFKQIFYRIMGQATILTISPEPVKKITFKYIAIISLVLLIIGLGLLLGLNQKNKTKISQTSQNITWNLPPLTSYYVKRKVLTMEIWHKLQNNQSKAILKQVGLRGLGGAGKTILATEAIHYPVRHYSFRGWFRAETQDLLKTDYVDLGENLKIITKDMSEKQKLITIKQWLESQPSSLLVYDNASDMKTIHDYLPNKGHIIITSRNHQMPGAIDVEGMTEKEAIQLLNHLIPTELKKTTNYNILLKNLAKELGYLPLALSQAGTYIAENKETVANYLKLYHHERKKLMSQQLLPPEDRHEPVYVTWNLNIQAIQQQLQGEQAINLLNLIAYLYPENIPKVLFTRSELIGNCDTLSEKLNKLNNLINVLTKYSLVKVSHDGISIHRLVQAYLRDCHDKKTKNIILEKLQRLVGVIYETEKEDYQLLKSLLPHITNIFDQGKDMLSKNQQLNLKKLFAWMTYAAGDFSRAKKIFEEILPIYGNQYGKDSLEIAEIYHNLGHSCQDLGKIYLSIQHFRKALAIHEKILGDNHVECAHDLRGLAWSLLELDKSVESKDAFETIVKIYKNYYGENNIKVAIASRGLASSYLALNRPDLAKNYFLHTLSLHQLYYNPTHIRTAHVYYGLGKTYYVLGKTQEAKTYLEKALLIFMAHHGEKHIWVARLYSVLAEVYLALDKITEADEILQQALKIHQQHQGDDHLWTAKTYYTLGVTKRKLRQLDLSYVFFKKALPIYEKYIDNRVLQNQFLCKDLIDIYGSLGHIEKSKALRKRSRKFT